VLGKLAFAPPYREGELPAGYAVRIADTYGLDLREFCSDHGIRRLGLINGETNALVRLAALGGCDPADLLRSAFINIDIYSFKFRGHDVRRDDLTKCRLDICAQCALDDIADPSAGTGHIRAEWCLDVVDTCPKHGCALSGLPLAKGANCSIDTSLSLAASTDRLDELARTAETRSPTRLQNYVLTKLDGVETQIPFLDAMTLAAAVRSCEVLGTAACYGRTADWEDLGAPALRAARIRGFEIACRGEQGVRDLLKSMMSAYARRPGVSEGRTARMAFFALYDFLRVNPKRIHWRIAAFADLRNIVGDFIRENFPLKPGELVFGEPIVERKLHSVSSLAAEIRSGRPRVRKLLLMKGVIRKEQSDLADYNIIFDAKVGMEAVGDIIEAMSGPQTAALLGSDKHQINMLTEAGLIRTISSGTPGLRPTYARTAINAFVARLLRDAEKVDSPMPHQLTLAKTSRKAVCTQTDIVRLIVDDRLKWVGNLGGKGDYQSILVDVNEVNALIHTLDPESISMTDVFRRLEIKSQYAWALARNGHIKTYTCRRAGLTVTRVSSAEFDAFNSRYVTLGEISRSRNMHHSTAIRLLKKAGIKPALDKRKVLIAYFDRIQIDSEPWASDLDAI